MIIPFPHTHTHLPNFHPNPCCLPTVGSVDRMTKGARRPCQPTVPAVTGPWPPSVQSRKEGEVSAQWWIQALGPRGGLKEAGNTVCRRMNKANRVEHHPPPRFKRTVNFPLTVKCGFIALSWRPSSLPGTQAEEGSRSAGRWWVLSVPSEEAAIVVTATLGKHPQNGVELQKS